jgi:hypothetical protein
MEGYDLGFNVRGGRDGHGSKNDDTARLRSRGSMSL